MIERDMWLRTVELRGCDAMPSRIHISKAVRSLYSAALAELAARFPQVDTNIADSSETDCGPDAMHAACEPFTDAWGCVWANLQDGMVGQVKTPALDDWAKLKHYSPPSPALTDHCHPVDWERERRLIESGRREGILIQGAIDHGFFFQRLCYLRGFGNLMLDVACGEPHLRELCRMVLEFNRGLVERYLELGVDVMVFGDDLGMQDRLVLSPAAWRRYVKPAYSELFGMCRVSGAHVYLHSDGYIADILPELLECGVTVINPQDTCNGLDNLRRSLKRRTCIDLDIDRDLVARRTPHEIIAHIRRCVRVLGSPDGGLMLTCGIYPPTPLANIEAVFRAMAKCSSPFAEPQAS